MRDADDKTLRALGCPPRVPPGALVSPKGKAWSVQSDTYSYYGLSSPIRHLVGSPMLFLGELCIDDGADPETVLAKCLTAFGIRWVVWKCLEVVA